VIITTSSVRFFCAALLRNSRPRIGMSLVYVAIGFMTFMAASTLAIDVGMFMTARSQAQNAADAGALAGAVALANDDFDDRTPAGPAVQVAMSTAQKNLIIGDAPSVLTTDVTFPDDPSGQPTRVRVNVFRVAARDTAIPTLIGPLFGVPTVDIGATATAEASPANAMTCVKPFMIPDKWIENSDDKDKADGPWSPDVEFNVQDASGKPLKNPDVYVSADDPAHFTGFDATRDVGTDMVLRAGTGTNISPSFYYSWKMPGDTGGSFYRDNIAGCNNASVTWGDPMVQEPGNMVGPTTQGIRDLIAQDPDARWDTTCNCVVDSKLGDGSRSPRVFPIPLYDPLFYATGKQNGRTADFKVANYIGFFVEWEGGNEIHGRITKISGVINDKGPKPGAAFPKVIRLVQ
jgi:Flp pilus assembly protein TadG